jgi:NhaP-type Na+/H+ or K+/H+ antiporter
MDNKSRSKLINAFLVGITAAVISLILSKFSISYLVQAVIVGAAVLVAALILTHHSSKTE